MSNLTLAIIQSDIYWEDVDANLSMFEEKIWSIENTVDVILLPETFNAGFSMNLEKIAEVPGLKTQKWLLQMAAQKNALVGGSYIVKESGKYYNRFFGAKPDGTFETNDKRHLFSLSEEENLLTASRERNIFHFRGWNICPLICYDLRFPAWARNHYDDASKSYDYDLLVYSGSWPKTRIAAWDILLKARAVENQCYVAGINRMGTDGNNLDYVGHSALYDFAGEELAKVENREDIIIQKIEKSPLENFREQLPFLRDRDSYIIS